MKKIINHFRYWYGLYVFILLLGLCVVFFVSLDCHEDYLEKNRDYIITIDEQSYYCVDIEFNNFSVLFETPKDYMTLYLSDDKYVNVPKSSFYSVETVIVGPQPKYFDWLTGDY